MIPVIQLASHDGGILRLWETAALPGGAGWVAFSVLVTTAVSLALLTWGIAAGQYSDRAAERMFEHEAGPGQPRERGARDGGDE